MPITGCNIKNQCVALLLLLLIMNCAPACRKLVESPPTTDIVAESGVYSVDATAIAVLNGVYAAMNAAPMQGSTGIALITGLSADELTLYSAVTAPSYLECYQNNLSGSIANTNVGVIWNNLYSYIFKCNAAIEGLNSTIADGLTPGIKKQLLGEAMFTRAFFYFYLVNLFGDVPLPLTTDPEVNTNLARSPKALVYEQIIADLLDAAEHLSETYLDGSLFNTSSERVRPIKWTAKALLARVYLYTGDWAKSEEQASDLISNTGLFGLLPVNSVFLKNSKEAIWQLQPTAVNFNTFEAQTLVIPASGPSSIVNPVYLSNHLLNSFEPNDLRLKYKNWVDTITVAGTFYRFPYKYKLSLKDTTITSNTGAKNMKEYFMVLRLGEQYMIRAEARAQLGKMEEAKNDLNAIRVRAGLDSVVAGSKEALLTAILHEREVELFLEWGHRWLDLKRTGNVDAVMKYATPLKSNGATSWQLHQEVYPLPLQELQRAPNLVQNEGY